MAWPRSAGPQTPGKRARIKVVVESVDEMRGAIKRKI